MADEHEREPREERPPSRGFWDQYWQRFRRQQVDDPVEGNREGYWERFRKQQVDERRARRRPS